jgi:hypothetical protein
MEPLTSSQFRLQLRKMYRNCVYNNKSKSIHLFTWNADGNRVLQEIDFKPYLYLESKSGDARSIYGTAIKRCECELCVY